MCFHLAKNLKIKIHDWMMVLFFIKNCKVGNIFWQKAKTVPNYKKISTMLKKKKKDNWQWVQSNSPWLGCLGSFLTLLSQFFFFFLTILELCGLKKSLRNMWLLVWVMALSIFWLALWVVYHYLWQLLNTIWSSIFIFSFVQ